MATDPGQSDSLDDLLKDLFDPGLSGRQSAVLRRELVRSPEFRRRYIRYVSIHSMIETELGPLDHRLLENLRKWMADPAGSLSDAWVLPAIRLGTTAGEAPDAGEIDPAEYQTAPLPNSHPRDLAASSGRRSAFSWVLHRRSLLAAAIGLAAVGLVLIIRLMAPAQAAAVDAVAGAQWDNAGNARPPGTAIMTGRQMALRGGCVALKMTGGALVTLEAPTRFTLESGSVIALVSGKISVLAPGGGFTVHCPHATVVDLGTQFGVDVQGDGNAHVEVFQGSVRAEAVSGSTPTGIAQILSAGEAADVSAGAVALDPGGSAPQRFVLAVSSTATQLDVTDLVCGGDGTTVLRGRGIDVLTGNSGLLPQTGDVIGDHLYHRVPRLPAVDGVFVPDGSSGPIQIDSGGDTFDFPPTSGRSAELIWAGGDIPPSPVKDDRTMKSTLAGIDYSRPGHGFLALHCNKGLTFDLDAIRRSHPTCRLVRFQCVAGNTSNGLDPVRHRTTVMILVDGKLRFKKQEFRARAGKFTIDVPLQNTDRFLTLTALEAGDGTPFNWILFGDPIITLSPSNDISE